MQTIPTPAMVIDGQGVTKNIARMAEYTNSHGINLRPHIKTHKSKQFARMQLQQGAIGLTVAKVGEAEIMSEVCDDILMAYPPVDSERSLRLAKLAGRINVRVGLDSSMAAEQLSAATTNLGTTVGVLVDYDVGYGRTGVQSIRKSITLAQIISQLKGLRLDGLMIYTGHVLGSEEKQRSHFSELQANCIQLLEEWDKNGLAHEIVSSGSTPSAYNSHFMPVVTEIRPGTYIFNDLNTAYGGYCELDDCVARIQSTVISNTVAGQVVIDAGTKTLTSDLCGPRPDSGHGYIVEYPKARIAKLTEEHGQVDVSQCEKVPALGEQVTIIPNHICVCMNMQNYVWWQEGASAEKVIVDARGMLI